MPIAFRQTVVTSVPRGSAKENEYLELVQALPVTDPATKERPGLEFEIPLTGETRPVGAAKNADGSTIPDEERKQEDTAIIEAKRDLDAAGNLLDVPVTVRKQIRLISLKADGTENTRRDAKPTHALFKVYATAKQKRERNVEGADSTVDE